MITITFADRDTQKRPLDFLTAETWLSRAASRAIIRFPSLRLVAALQRKSRSGQLEGRWRSKLRSQQMGLNRNSAGRA